MSAKESMNKKKKKKNGKRIKIGKVIGNFQLNLKKHKEHKKNLTLVTGHCVSFVSPHNTNRLTPRTKEK